MNMDMTIDEQAKQAGEDPRAPEKPWLSAYLTVKDADEAIEFYRNALGFELVTAMRHGDEQVMHAEMRYRDQVIMFAPEGAFGSTTQAPITMQVQSPVTFYLYVDDVDRSFEHTLQHGATAMQPPTDAFWGDRYALITDPNGYTWSLAKNIGEFDPSKVPAVE